MIPGNLILPPYVRRRGSPPDRRQRGGRHERTHAVPVCGHLCLVYIVERMKNLAHGVPAQHVDVTCSRIVSRSWCADWHSRGMRVVRGDAYQPPSTHLDPASA